MVYTPSNSFNMNEFWYNWSEDSWEDFDTPRHFKETNPELERVKIGNVVYLKNEENRTLTPLSQQMNGYYSIGADPTMPTAFELTRDMIRGDEEAFNKLLKYYPEYLEPEEKESLWSQFVNTGVSLEISVLSTICAVIFTYIISQLLL